jgi:hypothetical protein
MSVIVFLSISLFIYIVAFTIYRLSAVNRAVAVNSSPFTGESRFAPRVPVPISRRVWLHSARLYAVANHGSGWHQERRS